MIDGLEFLPHEPPMRLVEEIVELVPGARVRATRLARPEDWFFQGHFPGLPLVPAIVLIELVAQAGGLAAGAPMSNGSPGPRQLRVAAVGPFKFPAAAGPGVRLDVTARVAARVGNLVKIEGEVIADGRLVATGALTLAEPR